MVEFFLLLSIMSRICGRGEALFLILTLDSYEWSAFVLLILTHIEGGTTFVTLKIQITTGSFVRGVGVRVLRGARIFSSPHPPASYLMATGGSFSEGKAAGE
jgi:hypothetical protein